MKTTQSDTNGGDKYEVTVIKTAKCDQSTENGRGEKEEGTKGARRGQEEGRDPNSARTGY